MEGEMKLEDVVRPNEQIREFSKDLVEKYGSDEEKITLALFKNIYDSACKFDHDEYERILPVHEKERELLYSKCYQTMKEYAKKYTPEILKEEDPKLTNLILEIIENTMDFESAKREAEVPEELIKKYGLGMAQESVVVGKFRDAKEYNMDYNLPNYMVEKIKSSMREYVFTETPYEEIIRLLKKGEYPDLEDVKKIDRAAAIKIPRLERLKELENQKFIIDLTHNPRTLENRQKIEQEIGNNKEGLREAYHILGTTEASLFAKLKHIIENLSHSAKNVSILKNNENLLRGRKDFREVLDCLGEV